MARRFTLCWVREPRNALSNLALHHVKVHLRALSTSLTAIAEPVTVHAAWHRENSLTAALAASWGMLVQQPFGMKTLDD
ncbi:hypothetical protein G7046_g1781 [Stylonectria norvegica]|nr:hypothetical protein G7046_g1781 [Stylonectria norvegica]